MLLQWNVCRKQAYKSLDAIVTGTAYGCLEDTGIFLKKMVEQKEEMLTPTAFIQSTHNTIGAQIALLLQCHNYNNTFVHRGFSFESALLDAMMLLEENAGTNVLVGAADEITDYSHAILSRFGLYKNEPLLILIYMYHSPKERLPEKALHSFYLATRLQQKIMQTLDAVYTFYKPVDATEIEQHVSNFLDQHNQLHLTDIDLVITGNNGDAERR